MKKLSPEWIRETKELITDMKVQRDRLITIRDSKQQEIDRLTGTIDLAEALITEQESGDGWREV